MDGLNIKNTLAAIRIAERVAKVLSGESGRRLVRILDERGKQARMSGETADAFERGFSEGLNAGCAISKFDVHELAVDAICDAVYGSDDQSC